MTVAMKDGGPVGAVSLTPGRTVAEIVVTSVSGKRATTYTVTAVKKRLLPLLELKEKKREFQCAVCCGVVHLPTRLRGNSTSLFCRPCLEELTRTNKTDPFTGEKLEGDDWMEVDLACDIELGKQMTVCNTATGPVEGTMQQIGAKLMANRIEAAKAEEPAESCGDCSKKVPSQDMTLHKELLCPAKHSVSLPRNQVKARAWENRLVDESCGSDLQDLLQKGREWEAKFLNTLPSSGGTVHQGKGPSPLDCLQTAARCYSTALKYSPSSVEAHIALGLVMEEFFYAEDLFGLKKPVTDAPEEGEAEISSKEEEFLAICQLHGVAASAPLALQLKAVEAEYHSLKDAGQTHKAEHVQSLHAWKSKKALQASKGSYAVDDDSPLFLARLKFQDACSVKNSDPTACFHLGRLCLLLGEREEAEKVLKNALAQKPTHSPTRFCLGLALGSGNEKHTKTLLWHGLTQYLLQLQEDHETKSDAKPTMKELHSNTFYHTSNTLIAEGFLQLASLGGHKSLSTISCLLSATACLPEAHIVHRNSTYRQFQWTGLSARSSLLSHLHQSHQTEIALRHCQELSGLIYHSGLESSPKLRALQIKVFQLGVELQPSSSKALCHLGTGQLAEHEATGDQASLSEAELSFKASIALEGQPITTENVPVQLAEQQWWKKRKSAAGKTSEPQKKVDKAPQPVATGQKTTTPRGPSTSRQPTAGARGAPTPTGRGRGVTSQPAAGRKPTGAAASRAPAKPVGRQPATRPGQTATKAPARPVGGGRGGGGAGGGGGGKGVATLGELKTGANKKPLDSQNKSQENVKTEAKSPPPPSNLVPASNSASQQPTKKVDLNIKSHAPRLGLARILAKSASSDKTKMEESRSLYQEVISMTPDLHDAYIELGEMLSKTDPVSAVDAYARFPFSDPPSFNDAYLHGEIVRLLMASENYDDSRLLTSLVAMGRALGIGVLEKHVSILENKFKTDLLKKLYSGVHGKPIDDPDLQAFFKFKCWR